MIRLVVLCFITTSSFGQFLSNASLEGTLQANIPPPGWKACNDYSTPDTQPGSWGISLPPSNGNSYVSLFTRGSGGFINDNFSEAFGTSLLAAIKPTGCYNFSFDLAHDPQATFIGGFGEVVTYENPEIINVWGGNSECSKSVLLYRSPPVSNEQWQTFKFTITPQAELTYLTIEADYVNNNKNYGNVLIDNIIIESNSVNLGEDQFACSGSEVILMTSVKQGNIFWSTGSQESSIHVKEGGTYSVMIEKDGCILRDTINITYLHPLTLNLGNDTTICSADTLILNAATPNGNYQWNSGSTNSSIKVLKEGTYEVSVDNGCERIQDAVKINIDPAQCCYLEAPNIFTPNNDQINDLFEISSGSTLQNYSLAIFNRWGKVVFETQSPANFWNGDIDLNQKAATGVYYWSASISCNRNGKNFENHYRGTITLIR